MPKYKLLPNQIKLIAVPDATLFFHTDKLHIYPLVDKDLVDFIVSFRDSKYNITKKLYAPDKFKDIYSFITKTISERSDTFVQNESIDVNKDNFSAIVLPIAAQCNLLCPYCFAQTDKGFNFKSFSKQNVEDVVDFVIEHNSEEDKPISFIFFGGEPLLNFSAMKHTVEYVNRKYFNRKIGYSITTNGTIVNEEIVKFLIVNNVAVLLSLDGPDNEFNVRKFRNGKKSYEAVLCNINTLQRKGIKINLRATFVSNNPYLVETYDFFEKLKIPFNIVPAYISENKTHLELSSYDIDTIAKIKAQFDALFEYYAEKVIKREQIYLTTINDISDVIRYRVIKSISCGAGINYYTIMANGDVFSCPHLMNDSKYLIGNINSGTKNKNFFTPVNINNISDCKSCWVKFLCLGGCLSQKISAGRSNMQTLDPNSCELEKIKWEFYLKLYYQIVQVCPEYFTKH